MNAKVLIFRCVVVFPVAVSTYPCATSSLSLSFRAVIVESVLHGTVDPLTRARLLALVGSDEGDLFGVEEGGGGSRREPSGDGAQSSARQRPVTQVEPPEELGGQQGRFRPRVNARSEFAGSLAPGDTSSELISPLCGSPI